MVAQEEKAKVATQHGAMIGVMVGTHRESMEITWHLCNKKQVTVELTIEVTHISMLHCTVL